jgi:hypothetical protein
LILFFIHHIQQQQEMFGSASQELLQEMIEQTQLIQEELIEK